MNWLGLVSIAPRDLRELGHYNSLAFIQFHILGGASL